MGIDKLDAGSATILVVEDEEPVRELLRLYLEKEGYEVLAARDGEEALEKAASEMPDLVLLDIMLPKLDGWTVCREIRRKCSVPVIMLTAKGEESDKILGLEIGADDYVTKPFSPREVVARVKAVLKRALQAEQRQEAVAVGGLIVNESTREAVVDGSPVMLRPKEFDLLLLFARNPGRVFSRDELLRHVWGYDYLGDQRTVDTHIKRLRKKLREHNCRHHIRTVWGRGYRFEVDS